MRHCTYFRSDWLTGRLCLLILPSYPGCQSVGRAVLCYQLSSSEQQAASACMSEQDKSLGCLSLNTQNIWFLFKNRTNIEQRSRQIPSKLILHYQSSTWMSVDCWVIVMFSVFFLFSDKSDSKQTEERSAQAEWRQSRMIGHQDLSYPDKILSISKQWKAM